MYNIHKRNFSHYNVPKKTFIVSNSTPAIVEEIYILQMKGFSTGKGYYSDNNPTVRALPESMKLYTSYDEAQNQIHNLFTA